jgi:subtilisin
MPRPPADGQWGTRAIREARAAWAELDAQEITPEEPDDRLIENVVRALTGSSAIRAAIAEAGGRAPAAGEVRFVSMAELGGMAPPEGAPFVIPEIGIVAAPAPMDGGAAAAREAVRSVSEGVQVEPAILGRAVATLLTEEVAEPEIMRPFADMLYEEGEISREWTEAALEVGAAAEVLPWGIRQVRAPAVWNAGWQGQGIRVAVVDTGIGPHIDLPRPLAGATFVPGTNSWHDDQGHGTHCAGTVAALRNGRGVIGVAPRADLLAAKVLDSTGRGADTWIAAGIVWAVNNGADIISLSLGMAGFSLAIRRALTFARLRKVTICAAAGNDYGGPVIYPAADPICIAVASTDSANRRSPFSNRGPELDIAAPGSDILSTFPGNGYRTMSGTSMATPHVAGVAALLLSRVRLDPTRVQRRLEGNALPLGPRADFGAGLVQADRAVLTPRPGTAALEEPEAPHGNGHTPPAPNASAKRQPARAGR